MKEKLIKEILLKMSGSLEKEELMYLERILITSMRDYSIDKKQDELVIYDDSAEQLIMKFLAVRRLDGLCESTLSQYEYENRKLIEFLGKHPKDVTTDDIRYYLAVSKVSKVTLNNKIRYINALFKWMEEEEMITRNPMVRIKSVKQDKVIRKPYLDSDMEEMRNHAKNSRDRAIIEVLYSTGVRVSELCRMNRIDIIGDECIVFGKGAKERKVYFSEKCIYYLKKYMEERKDNENALFIGKSGKRLSTKAVENVIRTLGRSCGVQKAHPHRFRRTLATNVLNRGMPLQEVKELLGHEKVDTTMLYCNVSELNVKNHHSKCA